MPLQATIKTKEERFKGDRPVHMLVVKGPSETFTKSMGRHLAMMGLTRMSEENSGYTTWASRYSPLTPLSKANYMAVTFGAKLERETREQIRDAVQSRRPPDGFAGMIEGRSGPPTAGKAELVAVGWSRGAIANCDSDDKSRRAFLEGAGWIPVVNAGEKLKERMGTMPYRSGDAFTMEALSPFMNASGKAKLAEMTGAALRNYRSAKAPETDDATEIPVPEGKSYLGIQRAGILHLHRSGQSGIIADDMGIGKTMQGMGLLNLTEDLRNALVVCKANMRITWGKELENWLVHDGLSVGIAEGRSYWPDTDVVVINYDILKDHAEAMKSRKWHRCVFDEVHFLSNEEAKRTEVALGNFLGSGKGSIDMADDGRIYGLSGTLKPNRIKGMWPILSATRPDVWGRGDEAKRLFRDRYEPPVMIQREKTYGGTTKKRVIPMPGKPMNESELNLRLYGSGGVVRRMKSEVSDFLPPKTRTPIEIPVKLTQDEKKELRSAEADVDAILERHGALLGVAGDAARAEAVIRTVPNIGADTPEFHEMARARRNIGLIKAPHVANFVIDELVDDQNLDAEDRRKTVIFAHHKDVISTIRGIAEDRMQGACLVYNGGLTAKKKYDLERKFQEDDDIRLIIVSLAADSGITLTAADRMRMGEFDWLPTNMSQVEDRIWRYGQERPVDIGYMFLPETLDARIGRNLTEITETDDKIFGHVDLSGRRQGRRPAGTGSAPADEAAKRPDPGAQMSLEI